MSMHNPFNDPSSRTSRQNTPLLYRRQPYIWIALHAAVVMAIAGCASRDDRSHADHSDADTIAQHHPHTPQTLSLAKGAGSPSVLMLTTTQERLANISVRRMASGVLDDGPLVNARIAVDEDRRLTVSSRVAGRIEKLYIRDVGRPVVKGEPLYGVYSETLNGQVQEYLLLKDQNNQLGAQRSHYRDLLKGAENKLKRNGLTAGQIERLTRENPTVTFLSPATGTVSALLVSEGQYVEEGALMYRLDNLAKLWLEAELYPAEARRFRIGQPVRAHINGIAKSVEGQVSFLTPVYRTNEQMVVMRVAIDNSDGVLIPGMQGTMSAVGPDQKVMYVPLDAVIRDGEGAFAFVRTHNNTYEMRRVTTGAENARDIEITDGLSATDEVVVSGAYLLYSEIILRQGMATAVHEH